MALQYISNNLEHSHLQVNYRSHTVTGQVSKAVNQADQLTNALLESG